MVETEEVREITVLPEGIGVGRIVEGNLLVAQKEDQPAGDLAAKSLATVFVYC
jgi:hypothetical protein